MVLNFNSILKLVKFHCTKSLSLNATIFRSIESRVNIPDYLKESYEAFCNVDADKVDDVDAEIKIEGILGNLKTQRINEFIESIQDIKIGYKKFLQFKLARPNDKLEQIYEQFCNLCDEETESFRDFFENINIRTSSEAICETIGSIMKMQLSKGRNLRPNNLDKEVFCRFNLPPFHTLKDSFIPAISEKWRKKKPKGLYRSTDRLKFANLSSSLHNFRRGEEKKSWFPPKLFNNE